MRIKRLEVSGFKSFLEKTSFNFTVPVTGVVGPNGCGKSNIVDAVKWVTGELSFKELRGRSMEDLIFAGSDLRPPTGMAEVQLTLDNSQGLAPPEFNEFAEISVLRRVFRDGSSEFSINKTPCRLRDIIDLFLDTGIGRSSYSIIEQGRVGQIVSSKPEERRLIIEEAAGITKFKNRKEAAERKMEFTRQNLLRVGDVLVELGRQIGSLERSARRAERYRELRERAREIDVALSAGSYADLTARLEASRSKEAALKERALREQTELGAAEASLERRRIDLLERARESEAGQQLLFEKASLIQSLDARAAALVAEAERLVEASAVGRARADQLKADAESSSGRLAELRVTLAHLAAEKDRIIRELETTGGEEVRQAEEVSALERELETGAGKILEIVAREAALRNERASLGGRREETERLEETRAREAAGIQRELADLEEKLAALERELERLGGLRREFEGERGEQLGRAERLKGERAALEEERLALSRTLEGDRSRLGALEDFQRTRQGYREGVRALMENPAGGEAAPGAILGLLGELLRPARGYERAVEAALAERIECILVKDPEAALGAIEFLKTGERGRGAFLPKRPRGTEKAAGAAPQREGIVGPLLDFVTAEGSAADAAEALLKDVLIVRDLGRAVELWEEGIDRTLVTPEGEMVGREGLLIGGSWGRHPGVLEVRREAEELHESVEATGARLAACELRLKEVGGELLLAESEFRRVEQALQRESERAVGREKEAQRLQEAVRRLRGNLEVVAQERARLAGERTTFSEELERAASGLEAAQRERAESEACAENRGSRLALLRGALKERRDRVASLRVEAASLAERLEAHNREVRTLSGRMEESLAEAEELCAGAVRQEAQGAQCRAARERSEKERNAALREHESARQVHEERRAAHEWEAKELAEVEKGLKILFDRLTETSNGLAGLKLTASEEGMRLEHLRSQIQERYGIDLAHCVAEAGFAPVPEQNADEARGELEELRGKMAGLGDVNLGAIEELRELKEREAFLSAQKEDLEKTLASLDSAIRKINATTKERFLATFEAVNLQFQKVFPRLFRGGRAKLLLAEPENLLETGIEIAAQPPGKRLQNMNLLSGGEKALTAIALLFAIFEHKAPPFCLLDEVDAPLDDVNVRRFLNLVREMSAATQFILITHNKATMEVVDNLYGITMEEPGVSRTVSVRIAREAAAEGEGAVAQRSVA